VTVKPRLPSNLKNIELQKGASVQKVVFNSRVAVWNARSMMNKSTHVSDLIINHNLSILAITEAWLKGDVRDDPCLADISNTLPDFAIHQLPRLCKDGGGICVILKKGYVVKYVPHKFNSFECLELSISSGEKDAIQLFVVYRPSTITINKQFFDEFSTLLESASLASGQLLISGDFNIHMDDVKCY
jgi:hypothetical protein